MIRAPFLISVLFSCCTFGVAAQGKVGVGTVSVHSSAALEARSSAKGMLLPRMDSSQRNAIANPATGLIVFDVTTSSFWFRGSQSWVELTDTINNVWSDHGDIVSPAGSNVGIGKAAPPNKLSVNGTIGLYNNTQVSGLLSTVGTDLRVNAKTGSAVLGSTAGDIIMQHSSIPLSLTGKVGIGLNDPLVKLHVAGGSEVTGSSGGFLQLGAAPDFNMGMDENEIQVRTSVPGKLDLQSGGDDLQIDGGTSYIVVNDGNQLYRYRPFTNPVDLLPIAYAKCQIYPSPTVVSGTGNVIVSQLDEGEYRVLLTGVSDLYTNSNQYVIFVSAYDTGSKIINYTIANDSSIRVYVHQPKIFYSNNWCKGLTVCPVYNSHIYSDTFFERRDANFFIMVYKVS